jgi:hypothetical protein
LIGRVGDFVRLNGTGVYQDILRFTLDSAAIKRQIFFEQEEDVSPSQ